MADLENMIRYTGDASTYFKPQLVQFVQTHITFSADKNSELSNMQEFEEKVALKLREERVGDFSRKIIENPESLEERFSSPVQRLMRQSTDIESQAVPRTASVKVASTKKSGAFKPV